MPVPFQPFELSWLIRACQCLVQHANSIMSRPSETPGLVEKVMATALPVRTRRRARALATPSTAIISPDAMQPLSKAKTGVPTVKTLSQVRDAQPAWAWGCMCGHRWLHHVCYACMHRAPSLAWTGRELV
jgi:hypothetical protein